MGSDRLYERLRRYSPSPESEEAPPGSLKADLERLVAEALRKDRGRGLHPLEDIVGGESVRNHLGEFLLVSSSCSLDTFHGDVSFSRLASARPGNLTILSGDEAEGGGLEGAVFLDTETTGLQGGSGTAAFLTGLGFVEGDRFHVVQYFMRDYHEEAPLFERLASDLLRFRKVVTYNGKAFDLPLLESRFRMNRRSFPLSEAAHVDLLHPARRLWKARLQSCRLQSLEGPVLGFMRREDIPGEEIPGVYFDYLRSRDGRGVARILEHNRLDILSLAALAARACEWVDGDLAEDPRDVFSLARVLERAGEKDRSLSEYRRVVAASPAHVQALLRLAVEAKREGDVLASRQLLEKAAEAGSVLAFRELAILHEHKERNYAQALLLTEGGLSRLDGGGARSLRLDFERRRARLMRRLSS
jgi:uncharacterized protein YprB with RNaseH-like and TPR domain